jgi:hypothetical protein
VKDLLDGDICREHGLMVSDLAGVLTAGVKVPGGGLSQALNQAVVRI